jgi:hypothetical protein
MVVCPLCENSQPGGSECLVCGHRLSAAPEEEFADLPVMDGLEPTLQAPAQVVEASPVPDLEPTSVDAVEVPPEPPIPDVEPTGTAPVDPDIEPMAMVERTSDDIPADEPTPYPAVVVCRYCRTEAAPGERICARCGMRLATADLGRPPPESGQAVRLCSCGTPVRGPVCPACGARNG